MMFELLRIRCGVPRSPILLSVGGGIGEAALGAGLLLAPEPTGLTKIGGVALIGHGADTTAAGLKQLWMGQSIHTFISQIVSGGLTTAGVPSPYAHLVGGLTEIGMAAMPIGVIAKAGIAAQAGVKPLFGNPASAVADVARGTGAYRHVAGHHVHAKKAFEGVSNYDFREAFSVSAAALKRHGVDHVDITTAQQRLFREFASSGAPNTLAQHSRIAYQAMV